MRLHLATVLWLVASLCPAAEAGQLKRDISSKNKDLRVIKREISKAQKDLKGAAKAEESLLKQIEAVNRKVDAARRDRLTHQKNLEIVEKKLAVISRRSAQYQKDAAAGRALLKSQLVALYKAGRLSTAKLLFSAKQPSQLISRFRFVSELTRHNARRIRESRDEVARLEDYRKEWFSKEAELKHSKSSADDARRRAEAEKRRRESLLKSVLQKKSRAQSLLSDLKKSALELENLVQSLEVEAGRRRQSSRRLEMDEGPSRLRRGLAWPVKGRVVSRFGEQMHPKFKTRIFNRGIEIAAPLRSPVSAVAAGTVRFAGYFEGYGQMVVLDHGGGSFTVYGHNSNLVVKDGDEVPVGAKIAEVGDSSTLGRPSLYFEVRSLAKAINPLLWLARR